MFCPRCGLLLEEHAPAAKKSKRKAADAELGSARSGAAELPPARAVPASFYARPGAETIDISAPPSVTENTTLLLFEQAGAPRQRIETPRE